jgi:hypothetical protein
MTFATLGALVVQSLLMRTIIRNSVFYYWSRWSLANHLNDRNSTAQIIVTISSQASDTIAVPRSNVCKHHGTRDAQSWACI